MKTSHLLFACLCCLALPFAVPKAVGDSSQALDPERDLQIRELAQECSDSIRQAANLPDEQAIPIYGNVLKRLGGWNRPDTLEVFHEARQKLLSIPGHAAYYRDKISVGKDKVRSGEMPINDWEQLLTDAFNILQHMPSEETVEVLSGLGSDKFGRSWSENPQDFKDVPVLHGLEEDLSAAGMGVIDIRAFHALDALGVEPPPYQDRALVSDLNIGKVWNLWWQEVKEGKRKYRFKGSSVEHPVNPPPGTGREVRRPERHPGSKPAVNPDEHTTSAAIEPHRKPQATGDAPRWPWLAGFASFAAFLLSTLVYFLKKSSGRS